MNPEIEAVFELFDPIVWILTCRSGESRGGLVASLVRKVSLTSEAPRMIVGISKRHNSQRLISESRKFALHLVSVENIPLILRFGTLSGRDVDKFNGVTCDIRADGTIILPEAIAWLSCKVETCFDIGDRYLYLVEIEEGALMNPAREPLTTRGVLSLADSNTRAILAQQHREDSLADQIAIAKWRLSINHGR